MFSKQLFAICAVAAAAATAGGGAFAQPAPGTAAAPSDLAAGDRAAVKSQTRRAAATKTLQPAGEAPDPVGGSARNRKTAHKPMHHRHHAKVAHRMTRPAAGQRAMRASPAAEPMAEPKK